MTAATVATSASSPSSASSALGSLAERYWRFECEETPLGAVLANVAVEGDLLFRESPADWQRRDARAAALLQDLAAIDCRLLAGQEKATHSLLLRELGAVRSQYATGAHLRPSLFPLGPDFVSVYWANGTAIADAADARRYVARLAGLPGYWRDIRSAIEAGQAQGLFYPRQVLASALTAARRLAGVAAADSAWLGPFKRLPARAADAVAAEAERAHALVEEALLPALRAHGDFIAACIPTARQSFGCGDTPAGRAYYAAMARYFTTTDLDPGAIHALGLAEVERLEAEIAAVSAEAGFAGDVAGYRRFLSSDPQFIAASPAALRSAMESLCKRIDRLLPAFIGHLPRATYGVDSIPEAASAAMPPAYAQPGPADASAAGVFWVSGLPAKCPSYLHVALAVHEAWPGHLMHIALLQEATALPAFRRYGAVKYTACIEGWALYCETLAGEMGLYTSPHQHYGRLEMELWRAVRLVVDTGIHWHGWSREQAIACMQQRLTLSPETIEGEVDRYAGMPGQALGYQIGNLAFRRVRARAEAALGAAFRHRDFHDALLAAGAVTLPVLERLMDGWIADRMASTAG